MGSSFFAAGGLTHTVSDFYPPNAFSVLREPWVLRNGQRQEDLADSREQRANGGPSDGHRPVIKALNLPNSEVTDEAVSFVTQGGASAVVLWAPQWNEVQPTAATLTDAPYDATIASMQRFAGVPVYIAMPSAAPDWATRGDLTAPTNLSPLGPWANYLSLTFSQLNGAVGFIVQNEPNYAFANDPHPERATARQIKCAAEVARRHQFRHRRILVCAAGSDVAFQREVLRRLNGRAPRRRHWKPPAGVTVSWAYHPYHDATHGSFEQTDETLELLREYWHAGPELWCTEGGYIYDTVQTVPEGGANPATWAYADLAADEHFQARRVASHVNRSRREGVRMWANYEYQDSLWGGWASGLVAHDGTAHPLRAEWGEL